MLKYFQSPAFFETLSVLFFTLLVLVCVKKINDKYFCEENRNKSWYQVAINISRGLVAIFLFIVVAIILSINGIRIGRYIAGLGVVGALASFALQEPIKDLIMGVTIIFEGYFKVGDVIIYNGVYAKVISFNVRSTKLFEIDRECITTVSNRNISEISIASDWIDVHVPVGYDQDLRVSRIIVRECARRIERLRYVYSCDFLNTQELAASWIEYKLRIHCLAEKRSAVRRNALAVIQDVFYEHTMEFPLEVKILYDAGKLAENDVKLPKSALQEAGKIASIKKKYDYELGKGAARSKTCSVDGSLDLTKRALNEVDRYMAAENIAKKMCDRVRLLTEEIISVTKSLTDISNGEIYVERDGANYEICYKATAKIGKKALEKFTSMSSSGSNEAYSGVSGVINRAIDTMISMSRNKNMKPSDESENVMDKSIIHSDDDKKWSLNAFKENCSTEEDDEKEQDISKLSEEIEQSVLTMLSDDVKISVRANQVSIRVLVKNWEDNE